MDQGIKIVVVIGVLLVGIGTALLFRQKSPSRQTPDRSDNERVILRDRVEPRGGQPSSLELGSRRAPVPRLVPVRPSSSPRRSAITLRGPRTAQWPPPLAEDYPEAGMKRVTPSRTHTIVDGDTLPALAEKYLGSAQRGHEIFQANRQVLQSPELLPIGAELKIPWDTRLNY